MTHHKGFTQRSGAKAEGKKPIQRKLQVNKPGDRFELEADAMADSVVRMGASSMMGLSQSPSSNSIYRCAKCDEEENKKKVMRKEIGSSDLTPSSSFVSKLDASRGQGSPLPSGTRNFMQRAIGADFSNVRIHSGPAAAEMSDGVQAKAFTYGRDVYFNHSQYNASSTAGQKLLAHELTHVVQGGNSIRRQPSYPPHQRGYQGEQTAAFSHYRAEDGWLIVRGPGGSAGHKVTASGEDGLAYNVRTAELQVFDNKSFARGGNVGKAEAIDPTQNLSQNLNSMIKHVKSQSIQSLPYRQDILRRLRQMHGWLRTGGQRPARTELVVLNAGGRKTGITERLSRMGITFRDTNIPPTPRPGSATPRIPGGTPAPAATTGSSRAPATPAVANNTGTSSSIASQTGKKLVETVPSQRPSNFVGGPSPRGVAKANALLLGLDLAHFILKLFAEDVQAKRFQEAYDRIDPIINQHRIANPDEGVLMRIHYFVAQPGVTPTFIGINYFYGRTLDEARENRIVQGVLENGQSNTTQEHWIPPLQPAGAAVLRKPFPVVGLGSFANSTTLQDVEWGGITGFDDEGESTVNVRGAAKFFILEPPKVLGWSNGRIYSEKELPVLTASSANGKSIPVIDLDPIVSGDVKAAMVFPADEGMAQAFRGSRRTRDDIDSLRMHVNFQLVRWVRPERVHLH